MWKKNDLLTTFLLLVSASLIASAFYYMAQTTSNIAIVYMLFLVIIARCTSGYFWGIAASIISVFIFNYMFTGEIMEFDFSKDSYLITFVGMLATSLITSTTTTHLKENARMTAEREQLLDHLNEINKKLLSAESREQIITAALNYLTDYSQASAAFYSSDPADGEAPVIQQAGGGNTGIFFEADNLRAAREAFSSKSRVSASCSYFPLLSHNTVWGVFGISHEGRPSLSQEALKLLLLTIPQIAMAMERQTLSVGHQTLAVETEKEKTRGTLLRAISHDLRTPLTSIIGASSTYLETGSSMDESQKQKMVLQIREESNWLLNMVENLLTVTRIHAADASVKKSSEPLEEIVSESVQRFKKRYPGAQVEITIPDDFILISVDAMLIEQVIINLLENALKHSESSLPVRLLVDLSGSHACFHIIDSGKGIEEARIKDIFDGYSATPNHSSDSSKGIGIGLSICQTIVHAHGGTIRAESLDHGASFTFTLPLGEQYP